MGTHREKLKSVGCGPWVLRGDATGCTTAPYQHLTDCKACRGDDPGVVDGGTWFSYHPRSPGKANRMGHTTETQRHRGIYRENQLIHLLCEFLCASVVERSPRALHLGRRSGHEVR